MEPVNRVPRKRRDIEVFWRARGRERREDKKSDRDFPLPISLIPLSRSEQLNMAEYATSWQSAVRAANKYAF